jgi:hypothetical protein
MATTPVVTESVALDGELEKIKEHLRNGAYCRIEFSFAFGTSGTHVTAQLYKRPDNPRATKWEKVGPFLTTEENTRAALLEMFASLAKED